MKSQQATSLQKQTPINKCDSPCDRQKTVFTHGKNILKKINSKWFLLFLCMFFSITTQAQWNEDSDNDGMPDWLDSIWDSSPAGQDTTWNFNDGSITDFHSTTDDERQEAYGNYASNYGGGSYSSGSQTGTVSNANGTYAGAYNFNTVSLIAGPYFNGVNANGVTRVWVGNTAWITTNNNNSIPGATSLNTINLVPIYNYILPNGTVTTSSDPSGISSVSGLGSVGVTSSPAPVPAPVPAPKPPCNKLANANLSDLVYNTSNGMQLDPSKLPSNVTIVTPPSFLLSTTNSMEQLQFTNPNTGFNSALYRVDNGNGNIEYVYATAGTDDILDAITDYKQAFDQWTSQYSQSVYNANKLNEWAANNGYTLSFTGHSLGGGLANANALATGLNATLYNPAGLSQGTIDDTDLDLDMGNQGNVTAYVVSGEPVNIFNGLLGTPIRAGIIKKIGDPVTNYIAASLVSLTPAEIKLHMMSTVKALIDCNN